MFIVPRVTQFSWAIVVNCCGKLWAVQVANNAMNTVNNERLAWLKFDELGEFAYFAKRSSSKVSSSPIFADILDKIHQTLCCQINCYAVLPNFSLAKLSSFTVQY